MIEGGGGTVTVVPEIQRTKFAKNFWNITFATFATLTGYALQVVWMARTHIKWSRSYPLPAIFRAPPEDRSVSYAPFVSPITADLISNYTLPVIRRILEEVLAVGECYIYILPYSSVSIER